jgi:HAD superfamily hydrolase (TIGR01490 family)
MAVTPQKKFAIFDIDGTIFRSSLVAEVVEELISEHIFEENVRDTFSKQKEAWLDRRGDYEAYINAMVQAFMKNIKGVQYKELEWASKKIVDRLGFRVYRHTTELVSSLRDKGYYLVAISHSPKIVVDQFARRLGFHKVYGIMYEVGPNDKFTGMLQDLHLIGNKANIVKRVIEKENLSRRGSIGVGDTETDISFLELVEKPLAFNPNKKLLTYARRMGWPVIVERKDVIYKL